MLPSPTYEALPPQPHCVRLQRARVRPSREAGQGDASGARCGVAKIMQRVPHDMRQNSRCERWPP